MSKTTLYIHIVWATKHRQPLLAPVKEESVFRCATTLITRLGYETVAINGMPDHVHLLVQCGGKNRSSNADEASEGRHFRYVERYVLAH